MRIPHSSAIHKSLPPTPSLCNARVRSDRLRYRHASIIPRPPREPEKNKEVERSRREIREQKGLVANQKADILRLEEKLVGECRYRDNRIAKLEQENAKLRGSLQEMEAQARQARSMQEQLKQTRELLGAMATQLSEAQTLLSTEDRLSEMEVLGIVRDLNENIYQVTIILTGEWEKLEPSQAIGLIEVDFTSQSATPSSFS